MGSIKSIIIMLLSTMIFVSELDVYASDKFIGIESKIDSSSNVTKVKKMQNALKEFNIYTGSIDGNYSSSLPALLAYQKNTGIIQSETDFGAGYFGEKTLLSLNEDFPEIFDSVIKKYLQMEELATSPTYFYVTAYYSPLPGQRRYITGTFEGDIKLNGEGKHTASGKQVFSGLIAAPSNYKFGTKIELEGIGVGEVSDRGGSIVNSGEKGHDYDRIDVWMGFGDEGLYRALKWGKRKITGKIVPNTIEVSMEFDPSPVVKYGNLIVDAEKPIQEDVIKLQNLLTEVKIYTGAIDGNFNNVKIDLIKFQVENNIISSKNDPQAGFFGNKTLGVLRDRFGGNIFKAKNNQPDEEIILSPEVKGKLDIVNIKITKLIDSKYGKNTQKAIEYRGKLRNMIDKQTKKVNSDLRKNQLKYLKSII